MAEAKRDNNQVEVMMGVLNTDGTTPTRIYADPNTAAIKVSDGSTGTNLGATRASRDNSGIPVLIAVSNTDGTTPIPLNVDSNGNLLIKST